MHYICRSRMSRIWSSWSRVLCGRFPLASAPAFVIVAVSMLMTQGCGAMILSSMSWGSRPEKLSVGVGKEEAQAELGRPIASHTTPDGGRIDDYEFRVYQAGEGLGAALKGIDGRAIQGLGYYLILNMATFGAPEVAITAGYAAYKLATHPRSRVRIAFGPDNRVAWIALPPRYGPPDDAVVAPPGIEAIRERCRAQGDGQPSERLAGSGENPSAFAEVSSACVARQLAMWGMIGSLPPYGPPDDALVPLSIGAIRSSCWSREDGEPLDRARSGGDGDWNTSEDPYVRCVARRLAIWGTDGPRNW